MIEDIWAEIKTKSGFSRCQMVKTKPPAVNANSMCECRRLCKDNKCGTYGTNWGCPPGTGTEDECMGLIGQYDNAIVVYQRIENVDIHDAEMVSSYSHEHQSLCRRMANAMRGAGYRDVLPLSNGGCSYCGTCAFPSNCRYPSQMVPSVSAFGINMDEYMNSVGLNFAFEERAFTLYCVILYNK
ncbi:MAG: DUF2284 domain-containing protein [Candidatus Methanomethylophilaceae archaeon]|nr:DUF2284 domain-containing protein [Candidatus Methanomethylophilaceae archaeon]